VTPAGLRHRIGRALGRRPGHRRRPGLRRLTRRSSLLLTVTAGLLSAVLLAAAVLLARDGAAPAGPTAPTVVPAPNSAVRIDPATYELVAAPPVRTDPAAVAGGGGSVWVANRDGTVTVVDPGTNRVQQTILASGSGPTGPGGPGLAFASGSLWLANTAQRRVARVEPGADTTPIPVGASPIALAAAAPDADTVWVAARTQRGGGLVARIDATSNQVHHPTVRLPYPPTGLAITPDGGTVWVVTPEDLTLRSFNTRTGDSGQPVKLKPAPDQVAYGDDAVWVTSTKSNAVLRINPATSKVETIPVGNGPSGIAFGADRVWVANSQDGTISAIDPQTSLVATQRLGFQPTAVAVVAEQRAVWVALAA
jgi:YVTN family beta-propeller protein